MIQKKITGGKREKSNFKNNKRNEPLISVIMVCLNSQKYLTKSINSVLKQSYKNFELIVIDGGSTDDTLKILKKNNNKIDFWISEKDKSHFDAMNKGIKLSRGSIISILNSDDVYYINTLKTAAKYFVKYQKIDFLFGGVVKHKLLHGYRPEIIYRSFGFYSAHSIGFFIRKKSQMKVGLYKLKYRFSSDYDLFYRLIVKHKMKGMATKKNEIFGKFRRGGSSSKLPFRDYLNETVRIRLDNGQNIFLVSIIFLLKYTRYLINKIFLIQ